MERSSGDPASSLLVGQQPPRATSCQFHARRSDRRSSVSSNRSSQATMPKKKKEPSDAERWKPKAAECCDGGEQRSGGGDCTSYNQSSRVTRVAVCCVVLRISTARVTPQVNNEKSHVRPSFGGTEPMPGDSLVRQIKDLTSRPLFLISLPISLFLSLFSFLFSSFFLLLSLSDFPFSLSVFIASPHSLMDRSLVPFLSACCPGVFFFHLRQDITITLQYIVKRVLICSRNREKSDSLSEYCRVESAVPFM